VKSISVAYLLWLLGGCGALGLHRFYLGKIPTGVLYLMTGGLGMVGSVIDFFTMTSQVREANIKLQIREAMELRKYETYLPRYRERADDSYRKKESLEHAILRSAKANNGMVTPSDVALEADVTLDEAREQLESLAKKGFAEMRIRKSGIIVYCFPDFMADKNASDFEDV
jgi:hypothetical protein